MFWADIIAKNLEDKSPHLVNDAKTPSGKVHVGSLRGVLIHDFVHKALLELGVKSTYTYHFDDFDPMDGLPVYLDQEKYKPFMGFPLKDVPSPDGNGSYAQFYAKDFTDVFNKLGAKPEIVWGSQLYKDGKLDQAIKIVLDNAEKIQEIYHQVSGSEKQAGWLPFQPVCPDCGKIGTTLSTKWDGKEVEFTCEKDMVVWADGCGYSGKVSPFGGSGKMPYKVEWAAKWFSLGVTIEGAGKDHSSKGGTRDVASAIMREVFKQEPPANIPYEHILIGGKKMSSSKGLGSSAAEVSGLLPPEILRFLFARVPASRAIDFDPSSPNTIPDLFDEFDRGQKAFFSKDSQDLAKTWQVSQIGEIKEEFNLRFSQIAEMLRNLKTNQDILDEAGKLKGKSLNETDKSAIEQRAGYVRIWLETIAPVAAQKIEVHDQEKVELTVSQKDFLQKVVQELEKDWVEEKLQNRIYELTKETGLKPIDGFKTLYKVLIGAEFGPRVAALILADKKKSLEAIKAQL